MKQRNLKIDQLKCLSAFFGYICTLFSSTGTIGENISAIARMQFRFFYYHRLFFMHSIQIERKKTESNQRRIFFVLCIIANFLYLIWNIILQMLLGNSIKNYLLEILGPKAVVKFLIFNKSPVGVHFGIWALCYMDLAYCIYFKIYYVKKIFNMLSPCY